MPPRLDATAVPTSWKDIGLNRARVDEDAMSTTAELGDDDNAFFAAFSTTTRGSCKLEPGYSQPPQHYRPPAFNAAGWYSSEPALSAADTIMLPATSAIPTQSSVHTPAVVTTSSPVPTITQESDPILRAQSGYTDVKLDSFFFQSHKHRG